MRQACFAAGRAFLSKINKWPDAAVKTLLQSGSNFPNAVYTRKQYQHFPTIRNGTLVQPDNLISAEFFITRSTVAFWQLSCCCIQLIQVCGTVLVHPQDYSLIRMIRIFKSHLSPISFSAHRPTRKMPPTKSAKTACFWGTIFSSGNWRPHWSHSMVGSLSKTSPSTGGHLVGDMLLWRTGLRSGRPHNVAIRRHYNRATRCRQKQQAKDNCNNIWRHRIRLWFPRAYCIYLRVHWTTRKKSLMRGTTWLTANSASIHHVCLSPGTWPSFANSFEVVKVVSNSKRLEFHKLHIFF